MTNPKMIFITLKLLVFDETQPFSYHQRNYLCNILADVEELEYDVKKPFQFVKNIRKAEKDLNTFDKEYKRLGGNMDEYEKRIKDVRDANRKAIMPF